MAHNFTCEVLLYYYNFLVPERSRIMDKSSTVFETAYDVVVVGFGGAGATAARFAADEGAKVLLLEAAPLGNEGGNTRYSAQMINSSSSYQGMLDYYHALSKPFDLDEEMIQVYAKGMSEIPNYIEQYLGVKPVSWKYDMNGKSSALPEYPELKGSDTIDIHYVHKGVFDAALWHILRQKIQDRKDDIDVWFESPAKHLIQDPQTKRVIGVQVKRHNQLINVQALQGVVLTTGGFENNTEMIQDYLGAPKLSPLGTLYNKGDGVKMGQEVGAKLWHMHNYEALGFLHGLSFKVPKGQRARLFVMDPWPDLYSGSIFTIAGDGSRYFKEDETERHGHIYDHGEYRVPPVHDNLFLIFDQSQMDKFKNDKDIPYSDWLKDVVSGQTIEELADNISVNSEILSETLKKFNFFAKKGKDFEFDRSPDTMVEFNEQGPYYAAPLTNTVLNTQGGPQRNAKAQVLNVDDKPLGGLYSAGELGGMNVNRYQAGQNIAECLIFGKIAGTNVAKENKNVSLVQKADSKYEVNDLVKEKQEYPVQESQYIGRSNVGIGDEMVVRITLDNNSELKNIEVLKQNESSDVGSSALTELAEQMVTQNSTEVDAVSGASSSSRAIKNAVNNALEQIK